jgi:tetratricopeptide (TPR) repeat protein
VLGPSREAVASRGEKRCFSRSGNARLSLSRPSRACESRHTAIHAVFADRVSVARALLDVPPMQRIFSAFAVVTAVFAVGCGSTLNNSKTAPPASPLKDPVALVEDGDAFAQNGDFTRAQQYYAAAIGAGGKSSAILPRLLKACIAGGDLRLASEYAETALARNPDDAHLRFVTGALQAQIGNRPAARDHLVIAAKELDKDANVQFSVATFFRDDMQDRIEADPYFREYLKLSPKGEHAAEARGSLMERMQ